MADVVPSLLIVALVKLRKKLAAPDGSQTSGRLVEGAREQRLHAASAERRPLDQTAHARSWTSANGASESAARKESSVVVVCLDSINLASRLVDVCTVGDDGPSSSGGVWAGKSPPPSRNCHAFLALLQLPLQSDECWLVEATHRQSDPHRTIEAFFVE